MRVLNGHQTDLMKNEFLWEDVVTSTKYVVEKEVKSLDQNNYREPVYIEGVTTSRLPIMADAVKLLKLFAYMYHEKLNLANLPEAPKTYHAFMGMLGEGTEHIEDMEVALIKGGAFKIKNYYLENDEIKDIRGASSLLTYVTETRLPEIVKNLYPPECIIYNGGGNLLIMLPLQNEDSKKDIQNIIIKFQKAFDQYTITVEKAFTYHTCQLREVLVDFKGIMAKLDKSLQDKRKSRLYNMIRPAPMLNQIIEISDQTKVRILAEKAPMGICEKCGTKNSGYLDYTGKNICGSCLHKTLVGREEKRGYFEKFAYHTSEKLERLPQTISDIQDERGYVAVIYGDGNNIGNVLQKVNSIYEMMQFSRKATEAASLAVYHSLAAHNRQNGKLLPFEVIALGGDDIFLIVPARNALSISQDLIRSFHEEFLNQTDKKVTATMSVGIVAAKYNNPVKISFELVQQCLKKAKKEERKNLLNGCNHGSIEFMVLEGTSNISSDLEGDTSLFPMDEQEFSEFMEMVQKFKVSFPQKTALYSLMEASERMGESEYELYYDYYIAKLNARETEKIQLLLDVKRKKRKPWRDILKVWDYC